MESFQQEKKPKEIVCPNLMLFCIHELKKMELVLTWAYFRKKVMSLSSCNERHVPSCVNIHQVKYCGLQHHLGRNEIVRIKKKHEI